VTRYGCIVADPPWWESGGGRIARGAQRHYSLMKDAEIIALAPRVRELAAEDSHLYLWVTNNFLPSGLRVMAAWGFQYLTLITWGKVGNIGLGQYYRGATEHVLFGRRGQPQYRTLPNGKRAQGMTLFLAPRGEHSQKPEQLQDWAEQVSPGPYAELFARRVRPGWDNIEVKA